MLWEEFSSVLLLPPCGKFEDLYIYILMQLTVTGHKSKKDQRKSVSGVF